MDSLNFLEKLWQKSGASDKIDRTDKKDDYFSYIEKLNQKGFFNENTENKKGKITDDDWPDDGEGELVSV